MAMQDLARVYADEFLHPDRFDRFPAQQQDIMLSALEQASATFDDTDLQELFSLGALHPNCKVRTALVRIAGRKLDHELACQYLEWAVQDRDEQVALLALQAARNCPSPDLLRALNQSLGGAVNRIRNGVLLGSTVADFTARETVLQLVADDHMVSQFHTTSEPAFEARQADPSRMVFVPAGTLLRGADQGALPGWFLLDALAERTPVAVEGFWMDTEPVTNEQYDAFVSDVEQNGHIWCHHDEPCNKQHRRSTAGDPRFSPNEPVTGVDWYDAVAYASWAGKVLPSEDQWERAARGDDGYLYPWGNTFDPKNVNWAARSYGTSLPDRERWLDLLTKTGPVQLPKLTLPCSLFPQNVSSFGIYGMSGNTWEWTRSRYLDRTELNPRLGTLEPGETLGNWDAYAAIKGGSWSSAGDLLSPAFRGKKHLLIRSPEIGFRCAYQDKKKSG